MAKKELSRDTGRRKYKGVSKPDVLAGVKLKVEEEKVEG